MLIGKVAAPAAASGKFWLPIYEQALNSPISVFLTQPGYFWSDGLMAMLNDRNRAACWLRLEPADQDPAGLLLSLVAAAQRIAPGAGAQTLAAMRLSPGPVGGWGLLYAQLGQELLEQMPENSVLVLEYLHQLASRGQAALFLQRNFLPWVTRRFPCILTSQKHVSLDGFSSLTAEHPIDQQRLDYSAAAALFQRSGWKLPEECLQAALKTHDGQAIALCGLCAMLNWLDPLEVETAILETSNPRQLFTRFARAVLKLAEPGTLRALAIIDRLAYAHPRLISASLGIEVPLEGPWLQALSDGWMMIYQVWSLSLRALLPADNEYQQSALLRGADFLFSQGAVDWAIRVYFECGAPESAARAIAAVADNYLDLGLWQTLDGWLKLVPQNILEEWPRLVYIQGEMKALGGETHKARAIFTSASQLFANRQDIDGFCQSKLAESALAVQQNDPGHAWSSALAASTLAARYGLPRQSDWANWQLGRLAAAADKLDDALAFVAQVSQHPDDPFSDQLFSLAASLALKLQESKRQREYHRQAYLAMQKSEQETARQLSLLLSSPLPQVLDGAPPVDGILTGQNWSQIHPVLKFASPAAAKAGGIAARRLSSRAESLTGADEPQPGELVRQLPGRYEGEKLMQSGLQTARPSLWQRLTRSLHAWLGPRLEISGEADSSEPQDPPRLPLFQSVLFLPHKTSTATFMSPENPAGDPADLTGGVILPVSSTATFMSPENPAGDPADRTEGVILPVSRTATFMSPENLPGAPADTAPALPPGLPVAPVAHHAPSVEQDSAPCLAVHCLGPFQVFENDQLIESWPPRKATSIFKYLLAHRQNFVPKDVLMDTFWPDADPEAARRNLHQAIYTLRQSLQMGPGSYQYIVFVNDQYRLNPDLGIWSDDEDFERHYRLGSQLMKQRQAEQGVLEFETAVDLYRGDFMAEDLYEDWPASRRNFLWQNYLEMAYRLAEFYFDRQEYSIAAGYCQRVVYKDDCQEEAHLCLMKNYLAQGKRYQAVQQYHLCRQALKAKLGLSPSSEMQALYRQMVK